VKELKGILNSKNIITQGNFLKGLKEEEEEPQKYIPNKERDEYEIGQNTTMMKTTHKKIKECTSKR